MWLLLGLFGGGLALLAGFAPLGIAGIVVGAICQYSQRKDDETWEQVQDTPASSVYPILSIIAALIIAAFCFAVLGLSLSLTL